MLDFRLTDNECELIWKEKTKDITKTKHRDKYSKYTVWYVYGNPTNTANTANTRVGTYMVTQQHMYSSAKRESASDI